MKKEILLASLLTGFAMQKVQAQNFVYENFNNQTNGTLPASWTSTPASQWKTGAPNTITPFNLIGASGNAPEHMKAAGINGNVGAAADGAVLATPAISLPATATGTKIFFSKYYLGASLTSDPTKKETFTLVASTNGGSTWTNVATIAPNSQSSWSDTLINVGSYAGQSNLKFGFKYNNTGSTLIGTAIDNVRIYVQGANDAALLGATPTAGAPTSYKTVGGTVTIAGSVLNFGTAVLNNYTVKYQQGAGPIASYNVTNANIAPLATGNFSHGTPFTIPAVGTFPISVWIELAGDSYHNDDSASAQVIGVSFMPAKRLVFEEGTGTWCGWCPRGAVGMENFAETNPGKAAQIAVHNQDPMAINAYSTYMNPFISGFPNLVTDRTGGSSDPGNIATAYNNMKNNFGFAEVTMGTPAVSGTTVTIPVTIKPAVNITNPKMALVVTESNITGTGSNWPQHNYYSGGSWGPMGGWETQAATVNNVNFHFVARTISPSPAGDAAGLPASLVAGTTYNATLTATLNSSWKTADLQYIALFMNGTDATIMNSAFSALPKLKPGLPTPTSVTNIAAGIEKAQLYPNPASDVAYMQVVLNEKASATIIITDATGRSVAAPIATEMHSGSNIVTIPTANLANGMYVINLNTTKGNVSMKLQVVK